MRLLWEDWVAIIKWRYRGKNKSHAVKSTVIKFVHLVLSNKFINTSPSFYLKYKLFKSYGLCQLYVNMSDIDECSSTSSCSENE